MTSLLGILNTGRTGIIANQTALAITGNNIANVNTEGYSRQRAQMSSLTTGGVQVNCIQRLRDAYLAHRLQDANTQMGGSSVLSTNLKTIESLMNETDDSGLTHSIRNFFNTFQDLSAQPGGTTEREMVRSSGQQLAQDLDGLADQLSQVRSQINQQVVSTVDEVNTITSQIAKLNQQVASLGGTAGNQQGTLNSLLDQRDKLIDDLSSYMTVNVVTDNNGGITVFGGGETLVEGNQARTLTTVIDPSNDGLCDVAIQDGNGTVRSISAKITEGSLGAMLQVRDGDAADALDGIERLSAQIVRSVNLQHATGTGLDGVSGRDFFKGLAVTATPSWQNEGGATVSATAITDASQLNFDDYEIRFTAAGQYDVVNTTTGAAVSSGNTYTPGSAIVFGGMSVTLSNASGAPATGDVFSVNAYSGTTSRMDLSDAVAASTDAIAAGASAASGDNTNALALAALIDKATMGNPPTQTFEEGYERTRLALSMAVQRADANCTDAEITQQQIQGMVDSVSGVSTDDEATNIIQFQRAYQASSRVISVTDELLQSLLNILS